MGLARGIPNQFNQEQFHYVIGLFDDNDNQVVHKFSDGTEQPIVFLSYPIRVELASDRIIH